LPGGPDRRMANRGRVELETHLTCTIQKPRIASNRGESQESARRCMNLRSREGKNRSQLVAFYLFLINRACRLESTLSWCKQTTKLLLIVVEMPVRLEPCSTVTVLDVAPGTGAGSLDIRVKYMESGCATAAAGRWALAVAAAPIHNRMDRSNRSNS
jgi:hypothetical protein